MHGQTGVSSNALVTSCIMGIYYKKHVIITHTQQGLNNLEAPLIGSNANDINGKITEDYFLDIGIDALIKNFKAAQLDKETVEDCCVAFPETKILLLPGTTQKNKLFFNQNVEEILPSLLRNVDDYTDILISDVSTGCNDLSFKLICDADLTVVNLSQNMRLVENYFKNYHEEISKRAKKMFFLFGNYDDNVKYSINNIRTIYRKYIKHNNSGVIPYCPLFLDAQNDRSVIDFLKSSLENNESKNEEQRYFIHRSILSVEKMLRLAKVSTNDIAGDIAGGE